MLAVGRFSWVGNESPNDKCIALESLLLLVTVFTFAMLNTPSCSKAPLTCFLSVSHNFVAPCPLTSLVVVQFHVHSLWTTFSAIIIGSATCTKDQWLRARVMVPRGLLAAPSVGPLQWCYLPSSVARMMKEKTFSKHPQTTVSADSPYFRTNASAGRDYISRPWNVLVSMCHLFFVYITIILFGYTLFQFLYEWGGLGWSHSSTYSIHWGLRG
jgi:hypothetical protein